jgi:hypothetical protein
MQAQTPNLLQNALAILEIACRQPYTYSILHHLIKMKTFYLVSFIKS